MAGSNSASPPRAAAPPSDANEARLVFASLADGGDSPAVTTANAYEAAVATTAPANLVACFPGFATPLPLPSRVISNVDSPIGHVSVFLMNVLEHPKDRPFLLEREAEMESLIRRRHAGPPKSLVYSELNSYQRLIVHRCADYFGLRHVVHTHNMTVQILRTAWTVLPKVMLRDVVVPGLGAVGTTSALATPILAPAVVSLRPAGEFGRSGGSRNRQSRRGTGGLERRGGAGAAIAVSTDEPELRSRARTHAAHGVAAAAPAAAHGAPLMLFPYAGAPDAYAPGGYGPYRTVGGYPPHAPIAFHAVPVYPGYYALGQAASPPPAAAAPLGAHSRGYVQMGAPAGALPPRADGMSMLVPALVEPVPNLHAVSTAELDAVAEMKPLVAHPARPRSRTATAAPGSQAAAPEPSAGSKNALYDDESELGGEAGIRGRVRSGTASSCPAAHGEPRPNLRLDTSTSARIRSASPIKSQSVLAEPRAGGPVAVLEAAAAGAAAEQSLLETLSADCLESDQTLHVSSALSPGAVGVAPNTHFLFEQPAAAPTALYGVEYAPPAGPYAAYAPSLAGYYVMPPGAAASLSPMSPSSSSSSSASSYYYPYGTALHPCPPPARGQPLHAMQYPLHVVGVRESPSPESSDVTTAMPDNYAPSDSRRSGSGSSVGARGSHDRPLGDWSRRGGSRRSRQRGGSKARSRDAAHEDAANDDVSRLKSSFAGLGL